MLKKIFAPFALAFALMMSMMSPAHALITATDLTQAGTDITTQAETIAVWALPIIGAVLALTIGVKLFKRLANKV